MTPQYSLILLSHQDGTSACREMWLQWLAARNDCETLVASATDKTAGADVINACVSRARGQYCVLLDERLGIKTRYWLEMMLTYLETSQADLLGIAGLTRVSIAPGVTSRLNYPLALDVLTVASSSDEDCNVMRHFRVEPVVMLDGGLVFARRDCLRQHPFTAQDTLAERAEAPADWLSAYSLRLGLFRQLQCAVLTGMQTALPIAWRDQGNNALHPPQALLQGFGTLTLRQLQCWQRNQDALHTVDPVLEQHLGYMSAYQDQWQFHVRQYGKVIGVSTGSAQHALIIDQLPDGTIAPCETRVLLGAGGGALIDVLLKTDTGRVLVVEHEPRLIVCLLKHYDWRQALRTGRLRFLAVAGGTMLASELALQMVTCQLRRLLASQPGITEVVRGDSRHLQGHWYRALESGLQRFVEQRQRLTRARQSAQRAYQVTVVSPGCPVFNELAQCFYDAGLKTQLLKVPAYHGAPAAASYRDMMTHLISRTSQLTIVRNRSLLELDPATLAGGYDALVSGQLTGWWWDAPPTESFLDWHDRDCLLPALATRQRDVSLLPVGSEWLPSAAGLLFCQAPLERISPKRVIACQAETGLEQLRHDWQRLLQLLSVHAPEARELASIAQAQVSDPVAQYQAWCSLQPLLDTVLSRLTERVPAQGFHARRLAERVAATLLRLSAVVTLVRQGLPVQVYGDPAWVASGLIPAACYVGQIPREHWPALYQQSAIQLVLEGSSQYPSSQAASLDVLACGGQVLTAFERDWQDLYADADMAPHQFTDLVDLASQADQLLRERDPHWLERAHWTRSHHGLPARVQWFLERYPSAISPL